MIPFDVDFGCQLVVMIEEDGLWVLLVAVLVVEFPTNVELDRRSQGVT